MKNVEYVNAGIGVSTKKEPNQAASEACKNALQMCKYPDLSIVYTNSEYDQSKFLKAVNTFLGKQWIGISTDKIFNNVAGYNPKISIAVLSLCSEYLHYSVAVAENYRKNPEKSAFEAAKRAVHGIHAYNYIDAYIQFTRVKNPDYGNIVRHQPYFVLTFISGLKITNNKIIPGKESEFVSGLSNYVGPYIPIFGGSASSSFEKYLNNKADNYQFANGKMYNNAAIVVFIVSDLHFSTLVAHGYKMTKDFAAITKIDETGYEILEINGREPIAEYARLLGIAKEEYLKDPPKYAFSRPFGLIMEGGLTTYIKEVVPNPDNKTLHSNFQLYENAIMNILDIDENATLQTSRDSIKRMLQEKKGMKPAVALLCSCSGRRPLAKNLESRDLQNLKSSFPSLPFFGFYSFGEVGSTKFSTAHSHSQTVTSLIIYNNKISD